MESNLKLLARECSKRIETTELKNKIKQLERTLYWEKVMLNHCTSYAIHYGSITYINYNKGYGYIEPGQYFNIHSSYVPIHNIQKDEFVVYRNIKSVNPKFETQAYIHFVCKHHEINNDRMYENLLDFKVEMPEETSPEETSPEETSPEETSPEETSPEETSP